MSWFVNLGWLRSYHIPGNNLINARLGLKGSGSSSILCPKIVSETVLHFKSPVGGACANALPATQERRKRTAEERQMSIDYSNLQPEEMRVAGNRVNDREEEVMLYFGLEVIKNL
jgi:hypothetical protein